MSINLIELAQEYFSDTVIEKISSSLGFDKDTAGNAIGKIFPSLMGLFGEKAQTPDGATQLFDTIKEADTDMLDNLGEAFSGDNTDIIDKGKGMLSSLLGGKLDSLTDIIGKIPGLSGDKAGGLMGLLAPVLTGMLGKQVKTGGLNASGLTSLLDDQKGHIAEYLGGDFTNKLGLGSFFSGVGAVSGMLGSAKDAACDIAGEASDAVGGVIDSAKDTVCSAAEGAADSVKGAACSVGGVVTGAAGAAKDVAGDAVDAVGGVVSGASGAVKGVAGSAAGAVSGVAGAAKDVAGDAVDAVGGAVSGAAGAAKDVAGSAAGAVSGAAGAVGSGVSGAAAASVATAEKAGGGLMKLLPIAGVGLLAFLGFKMCSGDGSKSVADNLKSAAGDATSKVGGAMSEAGDAISGAANSAGDAMSEAGSSISDAVGGAVDATGDAISGAASSAGDAMNETGSSISGVVGATLGSVGGAMNNKGTAVADKVEGAVNSAIGSDGDLALPSFVPTPDAEALSEKATALAHKLTRIQIPEGANIDELYAKLNAGGDSNFLYRITFATGETGVPEAHRKALIEKLQSVDPDATLVTIGYADTRGDDAQNKKLSYGRAKEVGAWIKTVSKDSNLESFSMGETDRFSRTEFSKNRVVEVWQIK